MNRSILLTLSLCLTTWSSPVLAQDRGEQPKEPTADGQADWYYNSPETLKKGEKTVGQLKSERRGQQRMARLEAMRWYGFSASRPTASGMPFTSSYSPSWTRPGGRPFSWYSGGAPTVVIHRPHHGYRHH